MTFKRCLLASLIVLFNLSYALAEFKKVCYFTDWAIYRPKGAEFFPEDINTDLCTHILYAFANVENNGIKHFDEMDVKIDDGPGLYTRVNNLKEINPNLKVLLSVGGWNAGSYPFEQVITDDETTHLFAKNVIKFLRKWKFDGFDIDWEYPMVHKVGYTKLLQILRDEFTADEQAGNGGYLLLAIATSAGQGTIDVAYEVEKIGKIVDMVNVMTYDMHGSWEIKNNFHSPLYVDPSIKNWENTLSVDFAIQYWLKKGCPREKLVMGVPFYGRGFKLINPEVNAVNSPTRGTSTAGKYVQEAGFLSYYEICLLLKDPTAIKKFDQYAKCPSVQVGNEWIGYENVESVTIKANYIKEHCLGGFMIWTIDFDDFKGTFCSQGPHPLLNALNNVLKDGQCGNGSLVQPVPDTTLEATTTTASSPPTSQAKIKDDTEEKVDSSEVEAVCKKTGVISVQGDCQSFQVCLLNFPKPVSTVKCPDSLWFDETQETCVAEKPKSCSDLLPVIADKVEFNCPADGYFPYKDDCSKFWRCAGSASYLMECAKGLFFNEKIGNCDYEKNANCFDGLSREDAPKYEFNCPAEGLYQREGNCNEFWQCANDIPYLKNCPLTLEFDSDTKLCVLKSKTCLSKRK